MARFTMEEVGFTPVFDPLAAKAATAIAHEWMAFDLVELAGYCQQAFMQGFNPVARPWQCIPFRQDDGGVTLWPTHGAILGDGELALQDAGIRWQWVERDCVVVDPSEEQKKDFALGEHGLLAKATMQLQVARVKWEREYGRLRGLNWSRDEVIDYLGPTPGQWDTIEAWGVLRGERDKKQMEMAIRSPAELAVLRARRQCMIAAVPGADMQIARHKRFSTKAVMQDIELLVDQGGNRDENPQYGPALGDRPLMAEEPRREPVTGGGTLHDVGQLKSEKAFGM